MLRARIVAIALLGLTGAVPASAQPIGPAPAAAPVLHAKVSVTSDVVTIGDMVDNAGDAAAIAIYRAPDPGTTGSLPTTEVLAALRAHQIIGVVTADIQSVAVTHLARTVEPQEIERQVAEALTRRKGLGAAGDLDLRFDRGLQTLQLDASNDGALRPVSVRFDQRNNRFDVTLEIANQRGRPTRLRFTGTAIETVEAAVLTRDVDRNDILKASDVTIERRPAIEAGRSPAGRTEAVGMQTRRSLRAGQVLRTADLVKPDLVRRDHPVTITYRTTGITLTFSG
jgi:flagella basal body P-ring formation protein FlgA